MTIHSVKNNSSRIGSHFDRDEYGFTIIPVKYSNVRISRLINRESWDALDVSLIVCILQTTKEKRICVAGNGIVYSNGNNHILNNIGRFI
jgi:hypothetical protein